jgi:Cu-Zn family superoxide dismutase
LEPDGSLVTFEVIIGHRPRNHLMDLGVLTVRTACAPSSDKQVLRNALRWEDDVKASRKIGTLFVVCTLALGGTMAVTLSAGARGREAKAMLRDANGAVVGVVHLSVEADGKILVRASASGLAPGFHGFHIHSVGSCDAAGGFLSAGGHFNPGGATHPTHAGDQPVLLVNTDGTAVARFQTDRYTVDQLFDADGSAFIVHAASDNYANIPTRYSAGGVPGPDAATLATGDAGGRSACGVITP